MTVSRETIARTAAELVTYGVLYPGLEDFCWGLAADLLAPIETTGADAMPHADVIELESRWS